MKLDGLSKPVELDWRALIDNIRRKGTPTRVFHMELFQDREIMYAIAERFGLAAAKSDPRYHENTYIAVQRFCGFDYVRVGLDGMEVPLHNVKVPDTAETLGRSGGRTYRDEHTGPITSWEDFERYPWPDPKRPEATRTLEWYSEHLPEEMCLVSGSISHFCEYVTWLLGYESFCYALYDQPDLLEAIKEKLLEIYRGVLERYLEFDRLPVIFASDDMGFKTGLLFSKEAMIHYVLEPHREIAEAAHRAGRVYLLHACGNLAEIADYLVDEVRIDGKHSFEDTIEEVRELKVNGYGRRTALIGGIDVDFLCRASEEAIRKRVRETLDVCLPGGGYCLGSGNSVANYIPLDHYLAMVDEGRRYGA